jgi:hypothetical protein
MAESYYELLRRPEWQKKRLAVMNAADFSCQECGATERTLNVHHRFYKKGAKPWEYVDEDLVCLCEECHRDRHELQVDLGRRLGRLPHQWLEHVNGYAAGLLLNMGEVGDVPCPTSDFAMGLASVYGLSPWWVWADRILAERVRDGSVSHELLAALADERKTIPDGVG